jgi:hypothetical protein
VKATQERQQAQEHKIMSNTDHTETLIQNFIAIYFLFK